MMALVHQLMIAILHQLGERETIQSLSINDSYFLIRNMESAVVNMIPLSEERNTITFVLFVNCLSVNRVYICLYVCLFVNSVNVSQLSVCQLFVN